MQALRNATAMFCLACVGSEAVLRLTGAGWPRRCIKAAAGLYILAVLLHAVPQLQAQTEAFSRPQAQAASFGTVEQNVLREAEAQLEQTLAAQCREETGVEPALQITLEQSGTSVHTAAVKMQLPAGSTKEETLRAAEFIRQALGAEPEIGEGGP